MTKEIMKLDHQLEKCKFINLYEIEEVPFYCQISGDFLFYHE